jgi:hypothetical protein
VVAVVVCKKYLLLKNQVCLKLFLINPKCLSVAIAMFVISDLQNNTAYITIKYADNISTPDFTCPAKVFRHQPTDEENFRKASIPLFYMQQK